MFRQIRNLKSGIFVDHISSNISVFNRSSSLNHIFLIERLNKSSNHAFSVVFSRNLSSNSRDPLDLTFNDTKQAYKSKKTFELIRAIIVLYASSFDFLVQKHNILMKWGRRLLGEQLFNMVMKASFYGHFVAGEDEIKIKPQLDYLRTFGVKSILDYSAEEDISSSEKSSEIQNDNKNNRDPIKPIEIEFQSDQISVNRQDHGPVARTYPYMNESNCEKNMEIFLRCIDAVAGSTYGTGFAAIKLTALGCPELLLRISEVVSRSRKYFKKITGKPFMIFENVSPEDFQKKLDERFNVNVNDKDISAFFKRMDYDQRGLMNLFSWNGLIDMKTLLNDLFKVPDLRTGRLERIINALSKEEEDMFRNMMRRIHTIAKAASDKDVRILVDAEQTYFQPAINRITLELMRKYNKETAIIFNTYQCYLKNAHEYIQIDVELSRRQNFFFGAKLVRGAYMEQERLRAKQLGYNDPINPDFKSTSLMYEKNLDFFMRNIIETGIENKKFAIMVATHNVDTVRYTIEKMQQFGIKPEHKLICFGQLYGMSDHISFLLGQSGYSVYKYVPYGPIDKVMPYLSRRAIENHGLLSRGEEERKLLSKELWRRIKCGEIFHKPIGNYQPV